MIIVSACSVDLEAMATMTMSQVIDATMWFDLHAVCNIQDASIWVVLQYSTRELVASKLGQNYVCDSLSDEPIIWFVEEGRQGSNSRRTMGRREYATEWWLVRGLIEWHDWQKERRRRIYAKWLASLRRRGNEKARWEMRRSWLACQQSDGRKSTKSGFFATASIWMPQTSKLCRGHYTVSSKRTLWTCPSTMCNNANRTR